MITAAKEWVKEGFLRKSSLQCVKCCRNEYRIYSKKRRPAAERVFIQYDKEDWRILCRHMDERPEEYFHASRYLKIGFLLGLLNKPGDTRKRLETKMHQMKKE